MPEIPELLTGGGLAGLGATVAYVVKLLIDGRNERAIDQRLDATTVNALIMETLKEERAEKHRIQERLNAVEQENERLKDELFRLRYGRERTD